MFTHSRLAAVAAAVILAGGPARAQGPGSAVGDWVGPWASERNDERGTVYMTVRPDGRVQGTITNGGLFGPWTGVVDGGELRARYTYPGSPWLEAVGRPTLSPDGGTLAGRLVFRQGGEPFGAGRVTLTRLPGAPPGPRPVPMSGAFTPPHRVPPVGWAPPPAPAPANPDPFGMRAAFDQIHRQHENRMARIDGRPLPYPNEPMGTADQFFSAQIGMTRDAERLMDRNLSPAELDRLTADVTRRYGAAGQYLQGQNAADAIRASVRGYQQGLIDRNRHHQTLQDANRALIQAEAEVAASRRAR